MVGVDSSCAEFGVIPTAISWLYHLIENQKNRTGARFSIRISALEIRGKNEELSDLLSDCAAGELNYMYDGYIVTAIVFCLGDHYFIGVKGPNNLKLFRP